MPLTDRPHHVCGTELHLLLVLSVLLVSAVDKVEECALWTFMSPYKNPILMGLTWSVTEFRIIFSGPVCLIAAPGCLLQALVHVCSVDTSWL